MRVKEAKEKLTEAFMQQKKDHADVTRVELTRRSVCGPHYLFCSVFGTEKKCMLKEKSVYLLTFNFFG